MTICLAVTCHDPAGAFEPGVHEAAQALGTTFAAVAVNSAVENIGARRLQTVVEKTLEELSFKADSWSGQAVVIGADEVRERVGELAKDADLSRFIL